MYIVYKMETTAYWKKVWITVTGHSNNVNSENVSKLLKLVSDGLCLGVLQYKSFTQESYENWISLINLQYNTIPAYFIRQLSFCLNLETASTWQIVCNFLMFEYYGKIQDIRKITEFTIHLSRLYQHIWLFYSSERIYMMKTLKCILENALEKSHPFEDVYLDYMKSPNLTDLRINLLRQFAQLIREIHMDNLNCCVEFNDWVDRNMREQIEILSLIVLTTEYVPLTIVEFKELLLLFREHNFGKEPKCYQVIAAMNETNLLNLKSIELGLFLVALVPCWTSNTLWCQHSDEIEAIIINICTRQNFPILFLAWATLHMTLPEKLAIERFNTRYHKFTKHALNQNVFSHLNEIASNVIFQNCKMGKIIKTAIYTLLENICVKFNGTELVLFQKDANSLLSNLMTVPELAHRLILSIQNGTANQKGIASIVNLVIELFPFTFDSYTIIISKSLQQPEVFKEISESIIKFRIYTEKFDDPYTDTVVTTVADYCPNDGNAIVIPAKSKARIITKTDQTLITFAYNYSYFDVLEDIVQDANSKKRLTEESENKIYLGLTLIKIYLDNPEGDLLPLRKWFKLTTSLFANFTKSPFISYKLIEICLGVFLSLMKIGDFEVVEMLAMNNCLPDITREPDDIANYFTNAYFKPGALFMIIKEEVATHEYNILFAFIKMLRHILQKGKHQLKMQIPGVVFLFTHIFPAHLDWIYRDVYEKNHVTYECMQVMLKILQQDYKRLKTDVDKKIYDYCLETATSHEPFVIAFMRLLQVPNLYLHAHIDKESNWNKGPAFDVVKTVKTCLNVLLIMFSKYKNNPKKLFDSPFANIFFNCTDRPSMLKVIADHVNHVFDKGIPKLACKLLKEFACYTDLPMFSLLQMDYYQIQGMFLEKLRDPLEDDDLKVEILSFITLCVDKQNGMTAAFFDITNVHITGSETSRESITSFMEEYLVNIQESTEYLRNPVQAAVLELFYQLWISKKDILVKYLAQQDKFWLTLSYPLFQDLMLNNKMYMQIYNIITIEIYKCRGTNQSLNELLLTMFVGTSGFTQKWADHIVEALEEPTAVSYGTYLLRSWKSILIAISKFCPYCFQNVNTRQILIQNCFDGLIQHFTYPDDVRILTEWSELYLYFVTHWPSSYFVEFKGAFARLNQVFKNFAEYYNCVSSRFKETMLCIAIRTLQNLDIHDKENRLLVEQFLESIGKVLEKEYMKVTSVDSDVPEEEKTYVHWLLLIIFANKLIDLHFTYSHRRWFRLTNFIYKIFTTLGLFLKIPKSFPVAKLSLQCLINYAESNLIADFLYVDLEQFVDATKPPKQYLNVQDLNYGNVTPWHFEEWWSTYCGVIQFMTLMVKNFGHVRIDTYYSFMYVHDEAIKYSMKLPTITAEYTALKLVSTCLSFTHAMLKWKQEWRLFHPDVYFSYLKSINATVNSVSTILVRPSILKFFNVNRESKLYLVNEVPIHYIVDIMNELVEILGLCNVCLISSSPTLLSLLEPTKPSLVDDVEIQFDFHVPKIYEEHPDLLNYGTVLCLLHFLCKAITNTSVHTPSHQKCKGAHDKVETGFLAFVSPDFIGAYTISERYNSLRTFTASDISGMSAPWLCKLNSYKVNFAIETLNTFLASQLFLTMHMREMTHKALKYIKRELCSELLFFHDFIRKYMVDQHQYRVEENMVLRRQIALSLPYCFSLEQVHQDVVFVRDTDSLMSTDTSSDEDEGEPQAEVHEVHMDPIPEDQESLESDADQDFELGSSSSLVIKPQYQYRYLERRPSHHLHDHGKELEDRIFYKSADFDRVYTNKHYCQISDTHTSMELSQRLKQMFIGKCTWLDGCADEIPIEQIALEYPMPLPIVDGDYLLFLSHWFIFMCQLTH